jgi:hypothetical protein
MILLMAIGGCTRGNVEQPVLPQSPQLVPINLVTATGGAQITRAGIDPLFTTITNATIIVFDQQGNRLQYRNIDYASGERVYLEAGGQFQVFAVANLTDGNCPGDYTAATYFADVETTADLYTKYFISTTAPGAAPAKMAMTSTGEEDPTNLSAQIVSIEVENPIVKDVSGAVNIKMRSIYTKVVLTIYNRTNSAGTVQSTIEIVRFLGKNLAKYSWIIERPQSDTSDYAQSPDSELEKPSQGYATTRIISTGSIDDWTRTPELINGKYYVKHTATMYTLENRRGTVAEVTTPYDRKKYAPQFALEVNLISYINSAEIMDMLLETHVLVGQGSDQLTPPNKWEGNYDVERNSIYYLNVFFDTATKATIEQDSRRNYLELLALCGELSSPTDGSSFGF